MLKELEVIKI